MKPQKYDLEKAFVPMPAQFQEVIEIAFERGDKEMKKRHKITILLAAAAVFAAVFVIGALAVGNLYTPRPDNVVLAQREGGQATASPMMDAEQTQRMDARPTPSTTPTPTPVPVEMAAAYLTPDFISYPVLVENAELVPAAEEEAHFYSGDFADADALYILLGNAYYAHWQESGLQPDSRVVYIAAEELRAIREAYPYEKEEWITAVRETLQSVLGFNENFIAEHYLINDVIACLSAEPEYGLQAATSEPASAPK